MLSLKGNLSCYRCATHTPFGNITEVFVRTHKDVSFGRQAKILRKLMLDTKQKRKNWAKIAENMKAPLESIGSSTKDIQKEARVSKRVVVLNKLFMKNITDVMATGEYSSQLVGHGIEISKVKVSAEFNIVNVFWVARGESADSDVERLLKKTAGSLRHELSSLRVMGVVPEIRFVKDKTYAKVVEVEKLLNIADYGEDYVPSDPSNIRKAEFTMESSHSVSAKAKTVESEGGEEEEDGEADYPEYLPPMRQDVFGLNHEQIIGRIAASVEKSKASHRFTSNDGNRRNDDVDVEGKREIMKALDKSSNIIQLDRDEFSEFLRKREVMKLKQGRRKEEHRLEVQDYNDDDDDDSDINPLFVEEEDYIEELEDVK